MAETDFRLRVHPPGKFLWDVPGMSVVCSQWLFRHSFNLLIMRWWLATKEVSNHTGISVGYLRRQLDNCQEVPMRFGRTIPFSLITWEGETLAAIEGEKKLCTEAC